MTGVTRDHQLNLRLTTGERRKMERLARVLGCGVSEAIRTAVAIELDRRVPSTGSGDGACAQPRVTKR